MPMLHYFNLIISVILEYQLQIFSVSCTNVVIFSNQIHPVSSSDCCAAGVLNAFEGNIMKSAVAGILLNNNNWTQIELTPVSMKI